MTFVDFTSTLFRARVSRRRHSRVDARSIRSMGASSFASRVSARERASSRARARCRHPRRRLRHPRVVRRASVNEDEDDESHRRAARDDGRVEIEASSSTTTRQCAHFVNLKNGIEALPTLRDAVRARFTYVRIQSSLLEAGDAEKMILELDASLLLALALGRACFVWDFGSRDVNPAKGNGNSRALWYGAEFIRYATRKEWFGMESTPVLRGKNVERDFATKLTMLSRGAKRKIRYYRQFIPNDVADVRLLGVYKATTHDDDSAFYRNLLHSEELYAMKKCDDDDDYVVRDEAETIRVIEESGFNIFYSGAEERVWLNQINQSTFNSRESPPI